MSKKITDEEIYNLNPFFEKVSSIKYRACVGNNSGVAPNSRDCIIIDGYKESVDLLYESMVGKLNKSIWIDTGIYPFLFNCRHSIELALKVFLKNLLIIYKNKNKIETSDDYINHIEQICKAHDLESLYKELINFKYFQLELKDAFNEFKYFKECVQDYFFDIDGDTFRYTFKRNWKTINFEDIEIIDVGVIYWKYKKLISFLDYLINSFSAKLNEDYSKTYTQNLSRSRLEKLSLDLKDINIWSKKELIENKKTLCEKYSISKSEFDKALKKINNHYSFCTNIGIEKKYKNLSEEFFIKLGEVYKWYIKKESAKIPTEKKGLNIFEIEKYSPLNKDYYNFCLEKAQSLTNEEKKVLLTFYEVISNPINGGYVCEDIDYLYDTWGENPEYEYVSKKIDYLVTSGKLREALIKCGQTTYLRWYDKYINYTDKNPI